MKEIWVFDVDGTLSDCEHRRHLVTTKPKNWPEFFERAVDDPPHRHILRLLELLYDDGAIIIIATGRDKGRSEDVTRQWFASLEIPYHDMFFRPAGDNRCDSIIKNEIRMLIEELYGPITCVVDDRDKVVDMWRSHGIPCLQVAEGAF